MPDSSKHEPNIRSGSGYMKLGIGNFKSRRMSSKISSKLAKSRPRTAKNMFLPRRNSLSNHINIKEPLFPEDLSQSSLAQKVHNLSVII